MLSKVYQSCFRVIIIEYRLYSCKYKSLPYYNKQTLNCLHWLESNRAFGNNIISRYLIWKKPDIPTISSLNFRLCKKKLHQYHYQDCSDLLIVIIKILHIGILILKMFSIHTYHPRHFKKKNEWDHVTNSFHGYVMVLYFMI